MEQQNQIDSHLLYEILERQIVPLYYERNANGLPAGWIKKMKASLATITPRFSAVRMVRDYVEQAYLPAARRAGLPTVPAEVQW
jgi:starch phosphorylase